MGKAQFLVSADFLAECVYDVIDLPWPNGTRFCEEDESEWNIRRCLHVTISYPGIPDEKESLQPLWCKPSFHKNEAGELEFESWNFQEDWE